MFNFLKRKKHAIQVMTALYANKHYTDLMTDLEAYMPGPMFREMQADKHHMLKQAFNYGFSIERTASMVFNATVETHANLFAQYSHQ